MKYLCIWLMMVSLAATPLAADQPSRLRPVDAWATESLERALDRSDLVRHLVQQLESSNLVVHIETVPMMPMGIGGTTRFVTSAAGHRYVRITLGRELQPNERAALLATSCSTPANSPPRRRTIIRR